MNLVYFLLFLIFVTDLIECAFIIPATEAVFTLPTDSEDVHELKTRDPSEVYEYIKDVGAYTRMQSLFRYVKGQELEHDGWMNKATKESTRCINQYIKCALNHGVAKPVCALHRDYVYNWGFYTFSSLCAMFVDNCMRNVRHWRPLDIGICYLPDYKEGYQVIQPRKNNPKNNNWNGFSAYSSNTNNVRNDERLVNRRKLDNDNFINDSDYNNYRNGFSPYNNYRKRFDSDNNFEFTNGFSRFINKLMRR